QVRGRAGLRRVLGCMSGGRNSCLYSGPRSATYGRSVRLCWQGRGCDRNNLERASPATPGPNAKRPGMDPAALPEASETEDAETNRTRRRPVILAHQGDQLALDAYAVGPKDLRAESWVSRLERDRAALLAEPLQRCCFLVDQRHHNIAGHRMVGFLQDDRVA